MHEAVKINCVITQKANDVLEEYQKAKGFKHKDTALSEFLEEHKDCKIAILRVT